MEFKLKILSIGLSESGEKLLEQALAIASIKTRVHTVTGFPQNLPRARSLFADIVITDSAFPDRNFLMLQTWLQSHSIFNHNPAVILLETHGVITDKILLPRSIDFIIGADKPDLLAWVLQQAWRKKNTYIEAEDVLTENSSTEEVPKKTEINTENSNQSATNNHISTVSQTEALLRQLNEELEARVSHRTRELEEANRFLLNEIEQRARTEAMLRESEGRFRQLAESIRGIFIACDKNLKLTFWNRAAEEATGLKTAEVIGQKVTELFPRIFDLTLPDSYQKILSTPIRKQFLISKNEHTRYFEYSIYPFESGISFLIHDITAQKKAENDIIELNKALEDRVKRRTAELQKANEELKQSIAIRQELEKERKQHHQALLNAVIQGQDQERQRIASELHEGLGQTMYAVKLYFESFLKKIQKGEAPSQEMIDSIKTFLDQTIDEVRSISHFLRPGFIADIGLTAAIVTLCNKLSASSSVQIHCTILEEPQGLGLNEQTSIYRIVQEILTNALKHAKPETIDITIGKTDNGMSLIITDDGVGFDLEAARKKEGIGLKNLTARVELLGGEIEINTAIGKGTQILIEIPLPVTAQKKVNAAGKNKKKLKNSSK